MLSGKGIYTGCSYRYSIPSVSYTCDCPREIPIPSGRCCYGACLEVNIDIPKPECETITDELYIPPIMVFYMCRVGIGFSSYHIEILKHLHQGGRSIGLYSICCECSIWCSCDIGLFHTRYRCPYSIRDVLRVCVEILHSSCPLKTNLTRKHWLYISFKIGEHCCGSTSEVYRSLPSTHKYITFEWHRALSLFWIINGDTITPDNITRGTKSLSHSRRDEKLSNIDGQFCCSTRYNRETDSEFSIERVGIQSIR